MTENKKAEFKLKLQRARRLLEERNFEFAMPLYELYFVATQRVRRMSTNGQYIYFNPSWFEQLDDEEAMFILSHQLLHISLGHIDRLRFFAGDRFHLACDIVVNSRLEKMGFKLERVKHMGKIYTKTFYPVVEGFELTVEEAFECVPFDPLKLPKSKRDTYILDSDEFWEQKNERGQCGTVVLTPFDAEPDDYKIKKPEKNNVKLIKYGTWESKKEVASGSLLLPQLPSPQTKENWEAPLTNTVRFLQERKEADKKVEATGEMVERTWQRKSGTSVNWRKMLSSFVQEDVGDYSFTPPDRRMQDGDFFLPDFNEFTAGVKKILFMVDTSGSVRNGMLSDVYTELLGLLEQLNGRVECELGFFDTRVYPTIDFNTVGELKALKPKGGGGTNFSCVFEYVKDGGRAGKYHDIVIFTDGKGEFPPESAALNIPVLWLFVSEHEGAPWGKSAIVR